MQERYWLRFESDDRSGEQVPIPAEGLTVGRRAGHGLRLVHSSVSGDHAELSVDSSGVRVRDLGSTNGTRVGNERVEEQLLAHGDELRFGNVMLIFQDAELAGTSGARPAAGDAELSDLHTVSAERLAVSGKRSVAVFALLLVALGVGGFFGYRQLFGSAGASRGPRIVPVVPVEGNLLADSYSFETQEATRAWEVAAGAPVALERSPGWRHTGGAGLGIELGALEWTQSSSPPLRARGGRSLTASAWARSDGPVRLRLGLEFIRAAEGSSSVIVWTLPLIDDEGSLELCVDVPKGFDSARLHLRAVAAGEGGAAFDDVSLVTTPAGGPAESFSEYLLHLPASSAAGFLTRVDQGILSNMRVWDAAVDLGGAPRAGEAGIGGRATETGLELEVGGDLAEPVLSFLVPQEVAEAGLATTGEGGYRRQTAEFEVEGVTSILLGADLSLVRVGFEEPLPVRGAPAPGGFWVEARLGGQRGIELQLTFRAERDEAARLAREARRAEKADRRGEAIARWGELLDRFPYDSAKVQEAEERRVRLIEDGLAEIAWVAERVERARFFELPDLFRLCRERAEEVGARYTGSEVERSAGEVVEQIDAALTVLESDAVRDEAARLATILRVLEDEQASSLSEQVRRYLHLHFPAGTAPVQPGDPPPDPPGPLYEAPEGADSDQGAL